MQIQFSPEVAKELQLIKKKDIKLAKKIEKQIALFQQYPKHPSLRIHKLTGLENFWSLSISMSIRMIYVLGGDVALFVDIGTHDQVYGK